MPHNKYGDPTRIGVANGTRFDGNTVVKIAYLELSIPTGSVDQLELEQGKGISDSCGYDLLSNLGLLEQLKSGANPDIQRVVELIEQSTDRLEVRTRTPWETIVHIQVETPNCDL